MTGSRRGNGDGGENVRKAASEQNPATRRVIRSQFLQLKNLINEKRDDLMNTESDKFDTILDEFDKLHVQVEKPREQVADAEALLDLTRTLVGSVKSLANEGVTPSQFVSSLLIRYAHTQHSIDWHKLGLAASPIFLSVHGSSTMLGPMDNQFKQRKMGVRRNRDPRQIATTRPQQLDEAVTEEKTDTDKNMATMFHILRRTKRVPLENLILNRESFAQSVENLFALSFLVKDGRAEISLDENRLHYVSPKNAPAANLVSSKEVSYTHFVFRYDYQDWKLMKDVVPDGKELMPQRTQICTVVASQEGMGGDDSQPALAVTPIRKLSRNRGRVVQEEGVVEESPECDEENASREGAIRRCKRRLR
ncbi:hypothetical protein GLYMA_10G296500v4 [Glycine max]|uniref:Non-structural maintenance of chromosomes element 4 n=1 Tax=Glycine max TaxID=3847 RepID=I1LFK1_SOYBN|nr:non-structural maintenance of chromosomes element 4 homolog A [Glycine max]KAG5005574.1 hypothetical protein JHK86_029713 [Glycine max]KAH1231403.1 Non-structural maintenance of chromosomes element 4 A [Glycine max]KRH36328.1 hypothetical protein GLYMA_10G296500v4 [Glycine max]|eukprot:XP_003536808.1 non-structural maintenance of chromosomes element 4 homolog A [Glycine max]